MDRRVLGQSGLLVSRLCFGALTIGPLQAGLSVSKGAGIIRLAMERGINFIDTAESYGTYPYIREALKGIDKEIIIASKSYAYTREGMQRSVEKCLRELGREVIDIFLLHEQESASTIKGHWPALEYLVAAREKGLVRAVGISTHCVAGVKAALAVPEIDVVHPIINKEGIGIKDGTREDMLAAVKAARDQGKGIYAMKPLGGGHLIPEAEQALKWVLDLEFVDAVACGMQSEEEVEVNVAVAEGRGPKAEWRARLRERPRRVYVENWCEGCGLCVERCRYGALELRGGRAVARPEKCILCGYCAGVCPEFCIKVI